MHFRAMMGWGVCALIGIASPAIGHTFLQDGLMIERLDRAPRAEETSETPAGTLDFLRTPVPAARDQQEALLAEPGEADARIDAHRLAAAQHANEERWDDVVREYRALFNLIPMTGPDVERAALAAALAGQLLLAGTYFEVVLEEQPGRADYWTAWGSVFIRLQRWPEADQALNEALRLNPDSLRARYYHLVLDSALASTPRDIGFWRNRSLIELIQTLSWLLEDIDQRRDGFELDLVAVVARHLVGPIDAAQLRLARDLLMAGYRSLQSKEWERAQELLEQVQSIGARHPAITAEHARASEYSGAEDRP